MTTMGFFKKQRMVSILLLLIVWMPIVTACEELKEQEGAAEFRLAEGPENGSDYPYYLVIGGGLSETLSVLRIEAGPSFTMFTDVAPTGSAIHFSTYHDNSLYAVCSLSNSVVVYDSDLNVLREVSVGEGANPLALDLADGNTAWLVNFVSQDVRLVDLAADVSSHQRIRRVVSMPAGDQLPRDDGVEQTWSRPSSLIYLNQRLFVTLANLDERFVAGGPGLLAVIDAENGEVAALPQLSGRDPVFLTYDQNRDLLWICQAGDAVPETGYLGNGLLEAVDLETLEVRRQIEIDGAPFEMLIADANIAYLANGMDGRLLLVDLESEKQLESIELRSTSDGNELAYVSAIAMDPAGYLYAAEFNSDHLYVLDPANDHEIVASFVVNDGPDTLTFIP